MVEDNAQVPNLPIQPTTVDNAPNTAPISNPGSKKPLIIGAIVLVIILVLAVLSFSLLSIKKRATTAQDNQASPTKSPQIKKQTLKTPKLNFDSFVLSDTAKKPQSNYAASRYLLKNKFSQQEAASIAAVFGLTKVEDQNTEYFAKNITDKENVGFMVINKTTGRIQSQLFGSQKPANINSAGTLEQKAVAVLQSVGVYDSTIDCKVTYQLKNVQGVDGVTFVECHRNWQKLGLPLVDFAGTMNMGVNELITGFTPGTVNNLTPLDSTVINVSNGGSGKARPKDFNTATVGFRQDGTIATFDSNLRWIEEIVPLDESKLITSKQALVLVSKGKSKLSVSVPSAATKVDWNKIYPSDVATSKKVNVNEIVLTYLENSSSQSQASYEPYFLIRGTAFLESGYIVKYSQALPAEIANYNQSDLAAASAKSAVIAGGDDKAIQLTAIIPVFEEPTPAPQAPPPTVTTLCTSQELAKNPSDGYSDEGGWYPSTVDVPGYGTVGVRLHNRTFYITSLNKGMSIDPYKVLEAYAKVVPGGQLPYYGTGGCALTTISPAIFLYPGKKLNVNVKLGSNVTFSYPFALNKEWNVDVNPDGSLITSNYLYYEYDFTKADFPVPNSGYVVEKSEVAGLISNISAQLGLKSAERDVLLKDAKKTLGLIDSNWVKLGLASQKDIIKNLPLTIYPIPDTLMRVNLTFAGAQKGEKINAPEIFRITRVGFTAVEVGVSIAK